jgi:hypothetical protein
VKYCCSRNLRHRPKWPIRKLSDKYKPSCRVVRNWTCSNLKVSYMLMSKTVIAQNFVGLFLFKFDLFTDIMYVSQTEIVLPWIKHVLIISIIIPYVYMIMMAWLEESSFVGAVWHFLMRFFN